MKAWYFSKDNRRLGYDDNRVIKAGITHKIKGKPALCVKGLHGSKRIRDALIYAPGNYVWRVELAGKMDIGTDKIAATERKYLWGCDATDVLWKAARMSALDVVHLWDAEDTVIKYLKTGDESLRLFAQNAAQNVVEATTSHTEKVAAGATAWATYKVATRAAERSTAAAIAGVVAQSIARAGMENFKRIAEVAAQATQKQNQRLTRMVQKQRR